MASGFDNILDESSRIFVSPSNPEDRNDLKAVDQLTKEYLRKRHNLFVQRDWECNTIAFVFVSNMIKAIHSHIVENGVHVLIKSGNVLNFYDLFEVSASNKKNEKAEKTGNINVKFVPGKDVPVIVERYEDIDNDFVNIEAAYAWPDDPDTTKAYLKIDELTRKQVKEKYDIMLTKKFMSTAITYVFIENLYRYMVEKVKKTERRSVMINFNDIIEFHIQRNKGDVFDIRLRPGYGAKLIIKSDITTEADEEED